MLDIPSVLLVAFNLLLGSTPLLKYLCRNFLYGSFGHISNRSFFLCYPCRLLPGLKTFYHHRTDVNFHKAMKALLIPPRQYSAFFFSLSFCVSATVGLTFLSKYTKLGRSHFFWSLLLSAILRTVRVGVANLSKMFPLNIISEGSWNKLCVFACAFFLIGFNL